MRKIDRAFSKKEQERLGRNLDMNKLDTLEYLVLKGLYSTDIGNLIEIDIKHQKTFRSV